METSEQSNDITEAPNASNGVRRASDISGSDAPLLTEGSLIARRYLIIKMLGTGGSCDVYLARDLAALDRQVSRKTQVVLKVLKPSLLERLGGAGLIFEEALVSRYLSHPNIIKVFDYHQCEFADKILHFLTMEYIEGETLADLLHRSPQGRLEWKQASVLFTALADALDQAHQHGIIHADVKPSNVMIDWKGQPRLIDFGTARGCRQAIARHWDAHGVLPSELNMLYEDNKPYYGFTKTYASRGMMADLPVSAQDDIYGFANLMYEVLEGASRKNAAVVWEEENSPVASKSIVNNGKNNRSKPVHMSQAQWKILNRVLEQKAVQRYKSVKSFLAAFIRARHQTRNFLLAGAVGLSLLAAVGLSVEWGSRFVERMHTWHHSDQLIVDAQYLVEHIFDAPVEQLSPLLEEVHQLPPLLREGVLAHSESSILEKTRHWVDAVVIISTQMLAFPAWNEADQILDPKHENHSLLNDVNALLVQLQALYPGHIMVDEFEQRIRALRAQQMEVMQSELTRAWQSTDFGEQSLAAIAQFQVILENMDESWLASLPDVQGARFESTLEQALRSKDSQALIALKSFESVFTQGRIRDQFSEIWQSVESRLDPTHNQELKNTVSQNKDYSAQENTDSVSTTVSQSTSTSNFSAPETQINNDGLTSKKLERLHEDIKVLWLDRALMSAPDRFFAVLQSEGIDSNHPQAQAILNTLVQRFALKIKYYQDNDPYVSTVRLNNKLKALEKKLL